MSIIFLYIYNSFGLLFYLFIFVYYKTMKKKKHMHGNCKVLSNVLLLLLKFFLKTTISAQVNITQLRYSVWFIVRAFKYDDGFMACAILKIIFWRTKNRLHIVGWYTILLRFQIQRGNPRKLCIFHTVASPRFNIQRDGSGTGLSEKK